jgi:hypothetical protein
MQTEPTGSPVPGIIPGPIRAHSDTAAVSKRGDDPIEGTPPRRRNPLAKLISHLRGDRYMVDAYAPGEEP